MLKSAPLPCRPDTVPSFPPSSILRGIPNPLSPVLLVRGMFTVPLFKLFRVTGRNVGRKPLKNLLVPGSPAGLHACRVEPRHLEPGLRLVGQGGPLVALPPVVQLVVEWGVVA